MNLIQVQEAETVNSLFSQWKEASSEISSVICTGSQEQELRNLVSLRSLN